MEEEKTVGIGMNLVAFRDLDIKTIANMPITFQFGTTTTTYSGTNTITHPTPIDSQNG